jgi:tryptophan 2-monooxygenase
MNRIALVTHLIALAAGVAISSESRGDPGPSPSPATAVVLVAGNVWDGLADAALGPMEILVQGGRIAGMGRTVERPAGVRVVDLSAHTVTPGFIDCHVHVTMRPEDEGSVWALSPADKAVLGVQSLRVLLDRGFTTVRDLCDMDFGGYTTVSLQRAVEKGLIAGPRMIVAAHLVSTSGGHGDARPLMAAQTPVSQNNLADGMDEIRRIVRTEVSRGSQWIKFGATGGFASPADDPAQVPYSQEEIDALVSTARDLGIPCTPHAYGDEGIRRSIMAGVRSVEHGSMASLDTLKLMEARGVYLVPTQIAVVRFARRIDDDAFWAAVNEPPHVRAKYRKHATAILESARHLRNCGVKVALGSDFGTFPLEQTNATEFAELVANGLSIPRALRAGTSVAAELLMQDDIGILAVGKTADIIAMPGDPFDDITVTERVDFVMKGGVITKAGR